MSSLLTKKPSTSILPFFFMGKSLAIFKREALSRTYTQHNTRTDTGDRTRPPQRIIPQNQNPNFEFLRFKFLRFV